MVAAVTDMPMPADPSALRVIRARIHGLANRGANICPSFTGADERVISCATCGYSPDVHLLRAALSALSASRATEEQEKAPICLTCDGKGYVTPDDAAGGIVAAGELFNAGYAHGREFRPLPAQETPEA